MVKLRKKLSFASYLLTVLFLFGLSAIYVDLTPSETIIKEAKAAVANLHLFWTGEDAPDGWTIVSDGGGEDFYNKFLKGIDTTTGYGGTGGAVDHNHTTDVTVYATTSETAARGGIGLAPTNHVHGGNETVSDEDNLPPYRQIKVIEYTTGGVPDSIPSGAIAIFDDTPPDGWTSISGGGGNYNQKFLRASTDATTTSGSNTHTHDITAVISNSPQAEIGDNGILSTAGQTGHTHTLSGGVTSPAVNNIPPYIDVILASKDSAGIPTVGMIGFFDDTPASGWTVVSNGGGAFNGKYLRGNTSYDAVGGGALTHTHVDATGFTSSGPNNVLGTGSGTAASSGSHTHTVDFTDFSTDNHEPPHIEVIFAKRSTAYWPRMGNWRWYADEEDEAPGTAYAAENTVPPQIEMGKNIPIKLRINIQEIGGAAENNSRKKLRVSTDQETWVDVDPIDTGVDKAAYQYYDGGGADNDVLSSVVLSGSSSTDKGIHNEANSDSPSNSDHPASTTVEFEYCIEPDTLSAANTTYYFQLYDQTLAEAIPLAAGKSYPSLTTAGAFSLTISTPTAVYLDSWEIGSSAYHEYTFSVGVEHITIRDNRGTTGGDSSGWTCSVEVTSLLTNLDLETIAASNMYWITNAPTGLFDAATTGITGETGEYMGSAVTALTAGGSGQQGLGGFTMLPTVRIYNVTNVGNYVGGVFTFTLI